jgi:hypothetical protein
MKQADEPIQHSVWICLWPPCLGGEYFASILRRPGEFLQALAALLLCGGIQSARAAVLVQLQARDHPCPQKDPFRVSYDRPRHVRQPRRLVLASRQHGLAVRAEGYGPNDGLMLQGCRFPLDHHRPSCSIRRSTPPAFCSSMVLMRLWHPWLSRVSRRSSMSSRNQGF